MRVSYLECVNCGTIYPQDQVMYVCPEDGGNLTLHLNLHGTSQEPDQKSILESTEQSIWRYAPLLSFKDPGFHSTPLHRVGLTPIYSPPALIKALGTPNLWIKDESSNPSASFKDRASAAVVARAIELHKNRIIGASTGNAGAALACMAASAGLRAIILAPSNAPKAKIAQMLIYGAEVVLIDGSYDQAYDLSLQASREHGWYNRNTGFNPYTVEGKMTGAFEIWEQVITKLDPDCPRLNVFVPVGDGNIISGIAKGFYELMQLGWIKQLPRLFGVQARGSAAIYNAFSQNADKIQPVHAQTIADSISVDLPRDGLRALRYVRQSGGAFVRVTDEDIISGITTLGHSGIFAEPAAAAAWAGLEAALREGLLKSDEPILVLSTGSGLKDPLPATKSFLPKVIPADIESLRRVLHA